jgi:hypothetical protein
MTTVNPSNFQCIEVIAKLQMWTGFSPEKGVEKGGHFWHDGVSQAHINALL